MRQIFLIACALALLIPIRAPVLVSAAGFTVNSTLDAPDANPGDGLCATAAGACTLRAAIQEANATPAPDAISVPAGTYVLSLVGRGEDFAATGDLDIRQPLSIAGAGASTVIDGGGADRIFQVIGPIAVQISGLTMRNGNVPRPADISADGGGGAIYVVGGGSLSLTNVTASGNTATSGAIAIDDGGRLTVTSSTISGNNASFGGAIFSNGSDTLTGVTITGNNVSSSGGGIYQRAGAVSIANSTVSGNTASSASVGGGGMLLTATASANIATSTFNGNTAPNNGGGIHSRGTLTIANATLSGNTARNGGGGLFVGGGSATLNNVTLADNHSDVAGVALSNAGGSLLLRNTIVASAVPSGSCAGRISSLGYNLDSGQTCGLSAQGDIVGTNPMLAPLASNGGPTLTHALQSGSPAIDAGTSPGSSGCEAADQRGQPRPTDGNGDGIARCDIGAVEAPTVSAPAPIPVSPNQPVPLPASAAVSGTPTSGIAVPTSLVPPVVLTTAPARVATAIAIVVPVVGASPAEGSAVDITWVLTTEQVEAFSVDDEPLEAVEAGEWLTLLLEQDGWLLVASDPSSPFWIAYDDRIEIYGG